MKYPLIFCSMVFFNANVWAQNPVLWNTNQLGGTNGIGTITRINGDGTGFSNAYSFTSGSSQGNLTLYNNSVFYGLSVSGGTNYLGSIFKYNPTSNTYTTLFGMDSVSGYYPRGSLCLATNGKYYGLTAQGGTNNVGTFFSFDPSSNAFNKLVDFTITNGQYPNGSVIQNGNKLFGMVTLGGANTFGLIFSFDINSNQFQVVHDFNFTDGFAPYGSLINGTNGKLYGMCFGGGQTGYGVVFEFDPSNNNYNILYNFNGIDGAAPSGSLMLANNGLFYGMTQQGGTDNKGVLFSYNLSTNTYTKLTDFTGPNGATPYGSVIQASNNKIYGITSSGGANNFGVLFSYDPSTSSYTSIHDCNVTTGAIPYADMVEFNAPTALNDIATSEDIQIFPQPCNSSFTIKNSDASNKIREVTLFNPKGNLEKLNYSTNSDKIYVDVSGIGSGVYFLKLETENGTLIKKIVKI